MRITALLLLLPLCAALPSSSGAADCQNNSGSCSDGAKKQLPFLEAAQAAASAAAAEKKGPAAPAPAAAAVQVSSAPATAPDSGFSRPQWLIFVGAALAGLYIYLRGGVKKGRKK